MVHAFVVLRPGVDLTAEELQEHTLGQLNERWTPTSFDFIDALPMTPSAKIDKKALRERYVAEHQTSAGRPL